MILGLEFPLMPKEIHAMAAKPSIDPARLLEEQLESASPDLLRSLLSGRVRWSVYKIPNSDRSTQ